MARARASPSEKLTGEALRAVEPDLSPALPRAYHLPDMAQVRNPRHVKALLAACQAQGVRLYPHRAATGFVRTGRRIDAVQTEQGPLSAEQFLVTAGAWTDGLLQQVGCRLGVRPVRGQIALLQTDEARPRPDSAPGQALSGAARRRPGPCRRDGGRRRLRRPAHGRRPSPDCWPSPPSWSRRWRARPWNAAGRGCGPAAPTACRSSVPCPDCPNLYVAAGHFRAGIQLSPATGRAMTDLLIGREPVVPLEAFRLDRPPAPPARTAFRS